MTSVFLALLLLFPSIKKASSESTRSTSSEIHRAFKFLQEEEDFSNLEKLSALVLDKHYSDIELVDKVFTFFVSQKDRKKLFDTVYMLSIKNSCSNGLKVKKLGGLCGHLRSLWIEGLWQLPFYDTTAALLHESREDIKAGQCDRTVVRLEDLEKKEGPMLQVLQVFEEAYRCLKSVDKIQYVQNRIETLRVFDL